MTVEGARRLKDELHRLKTVERPAVIQAIAEARAHGDLSENADYDAAKERQGFIEGRIAEIESKLADAQVIDPAARRRRRPRRVRRHRRRSKTQTAATRVTYQIVGDDEADIKHGKISISSPIARALIGKSEGDTADVQAPGGVRELRDRRRSATRRTHRRGAAAAAGRFGRRLTTPGHSRNDLDSRLTSQPAVGARISKTLFILAYCLLRKRVVRNLSLRHADSRSPSQKA